MKTTTKTTQQQPDLKPLYTRSVVNSLGQGMVNPFMSAYAIQLGASPSDMGWFQSSSNLSNNAMQLLWGRLSDKTQKRIPFIIIGSLIIALLYPPMLLINNPTQLIILLAIQALLGSMATPAWTALIGDLVPSLRLGRANASINLYATIGSMIATLVSGLIMVNTGGTPQQIILIPMVTATVCGLISALLMIYVREGKHEQQPDLRNRIARDMFNVLKTARQTPAFVKYCTAAATFEFFMSISWPLFAITQVSILHANMLQLALLNVVQMITMITFQNWAGKRADTLGRKPLLIFFRLGLITVPIAYAFIPDLNILIVISLFWGFAQALGQASVTAYLLDIAPETHRGSFVAVYNLILGIVTFFGSLIGGYLSDYTTAIFGLTLGMQIVYIISTVGRTAGALLHLTLKETLRK